VWEQTALHGLTTLGQNAQQPRGAPHARLILLEERDPLSAAQYDVGNDGEEEEEEDVVWTDDAVREYDQEEAEPDGQGDERVNRGARHLERLLSAVDQELLACAAQGVLHRASTRASATPGPAVAGSSPLTISQLEWLHTKRQSIFAAPVLPAPEGGVGESRLEATEGGVKSRVTPAPLGSILRLPARARPCALKGRRPHTPEEDDNMDQDAEEGGELESSEAGGKEEGIEGSRRRAAVGTDDGSTAELSAVGHLVAAYRLLLQWERGEGPMKGDSEKNNNDSETNKRTVSQHLRHSLAVVAGAGKRKIGNAYTYMTTATAGQQKDPLIKPRVQFEEEWRHAGTVMAGKLHLLFVARKGKHGPPSAWRSAYGRILESDGSLVLFPSKQSFQEKDRACLVLPLRRARFSFFSAPSDGAAGSHAAACGNALRVQDFDAGGEGSSVVLYLKFRKASSRDLWHTALKRARTKAVKCDQIANVEEEDQGRGEEAMGGLSAVNRDSETAENKGAKTNLQALLARAGDVNVKGSNGLTCLHLAALNGSLPSLLELLKVKGLLLEVRSDTGQTPLNVAVLHGNKDAVQALLQAGAHDVRFLF
jgi:hypothetical protein